MTRPSSILLVLQGSGGGIGRLELLMVEMLHTLQGQRTLKFRAVSREPHPNYMQPQRGTAETQRIGKVAFSWHVLREFLRWKPDVVIFSHVNQVPLGLPMRLTRRRARQVVMVYGWDVWFGVSFLRKVALGQVDGAWSISQYTAEKMAETTGYPAGRISLLVPVMSPEQARAFAPPTLARPVSDGKVRLLSIARLDPTERQKGIDHVLQAMQKLRLELTYSIVGDGGDRRRLEQLARSLGVGQRVNFAGWYNDFELSAMYRECDVFVLPSAQEGFGLVYLEAMAAGKPVIAARAGAVPEVVVDGVTGVLVDYGDIESLAAAIDRLSNDEALRRKMGEAGRMRFLENFGFEQATRKVAALLQDII